MYSLGGTLYHALTGHVPFEAPTVDEVVAAQVHTPLTPPNQVVPEVTEITSDVLLQAMAKNPAERFGSYDEFIMAMEMSRTQLLRQIFAQAENPSGRSGGKGWFSKKQ